MQWTNVQAKQTNLVSFLVQVLLSRVLCFLSRSCFAAFAESFFSSRVGVGVGVPCPFPSPEQMPDDNPGGTVRVPLQGINIFNLCECVYGQLFWISVRLGILKPKHATVFLFGNVDKLLFTVW